MSARARVYEYRVPSNGFTAAAVSRACAPLQVTSDWFPRRVIYYYYSIFRFPLYIIRTGIIVQYYYYSVSSFTTTTVAAADAATAETVILAVVRTRSSTCPRSGGVRYSHSAAPAYAATTVTIHSQRADNPPHQRVRSPRPHPVPRRNRSGSGGPPRRRQRLRRLEEPVQVSPPSRPSDDTSVRPDDRRRTDFTDVPFGHPLHYYYYNIILLLLFFDFQFFATNICVNLLVASF